MNLRAAGVWLAAAAFGAMYTMANVHVSLQTGWTLPAALPSAALALTIARAQRADAARTRALVVTFVSIASAAGFMAGGGNFVALPALLVLGGTLPWWPVVMVWLALGGLSGVFLGRALYATADAHGFPTARAVVTFVEGLTTSETENGSLAREMRLLAAAFVLGGALGFARDGVHAIPSVLTWSTGALALGFDTSAALLGTGVFMGARAAFSVGAGGLLVGLVLVPWIGHDVPARDLVAQQLLWIGATLLGGAALSEIVRDVWKSRSARQSMHSTQTPNAARTAAPLLLLGAAAVMGHFVFHGSWLACALMGFLALAATQVGLRTMAATDIVPTRSFMTTAQLALAFDANATTVVPNVVGAAALHGGDTASAMRIAERLGVRPARAVWGQCGGVLVGAGVACALLFSYARSGAFEHLPAPSMRAHVAMVRALGRGEVFLSPRARVACGIALALGVVLPWLELRRDSRLARYAPSAVGLGSAFLLAPTSSLTMMLGGAITAWLVAKHPHRAPPFVRGSAALVVGASLAAFALTR